MNSTPCFHQISSACPQSPSSVPRILSRNPPDTRLPGVLLAVFLRPQHALSRLRGLDHPAEVMLSGSSAVKRLTLASLQVASLVVQLVTHQPATWETQVRSLGWEDPVEKEMATHSSTLTWKIPWVEEPGLWGCKESDMTERLHLKSIL